MTADSGSSRGSVLVVDDDMVSRLVLAHMLRRMRFEVLEADDVGPATEMVAGSEFCIVFCDFSMPGGTGLDVLARLVRGPGRPGFVLVTGVVDAAKVDGAHFDSVDAYMTKPVSTRALRACVDTVLSNRSASP
ncbi:MAG TPA: response regulator [Nakamurella sp.]|nr:response regulator [Nakamurella sp.]